MPDPSNIPGLWDKVDSGDKIVISAQVWNAMLDAAVANRMGDNPSPDGAPGSRSATVIRIRNDSGAAVARFGILGINGPIVTPTNNLTEFKRTIALKGITPAAGTHEGKFAVLLEPLAKDKIGAAVISGGVPVQISGPIGPFAEISDAVSGYLTPGDSGSARILYPPQDDVATDQRWAVIRIGEGGTVSGGGGGTVQQVYVYVHIPSQTVSSGTRTYLTTFAVIGETPGSGMKLTSSGSETGMYADAPTGSDYLLIDGTTTGIASLDLLSPIGGAWIKWDSASTGKVTLELPYGPFAFSGQPNFAPGVTQASTGSDRQSVTVGGPQNNENGFFVAVTQNSGSDRTVEGYAWMISYAVTGGGGGGSGQITAMLSADATNATNTLANLSDLSCTLAVGNYAGRLDLWVQNSTAAEGLQFDFGGGSATFSNFMAGGGIFATGSLTYTQVNTLASSFTTVVNWSTVTGLVNIVFDFSLICDSPGTFIPRFAENSAHTSGTATVKKGSNLRIDPIS